MKRFIPYLPKAFYVLTFFCFGFTLTISAQCLPNLGSLSSYVLYTASGAIGNTGTSVISGNIGTNVGSVTGFDSPSVVNGSIYVANGATSQAASDLMNAYNELNAITPTNTSHAPAFGNETLTPGVYAEGGAGSIAGTLVLDGQGNSNAIFVFKIGGALTGGAASAVTLTNGAKASNVFWLVNGAVSMGASSTLRGTIIANGALSMADGGMLYGRLLSTTGAIALYNVNSHFEGVETSDAVGGTVSSNQTVCSGTNSSILTLIGHTGSVTKWQSSPVSDFSSGVTNIANTTTTLTATNLTATSYYRAVLTSGACTSADSAIATITVSPPSVGGSISGSTTVCSGTNSTTLTLSGHTGSITKWQSSPLSDFSSEVIDIANTTSSLTATDLIVTLNYRAIITSGTCASAESSFGTITVNGNVSGSATVFSGSNSTTLTLTGHTGSITKWESSTVSDFSSGVTDIVNTTTILTATNLTATTYYRAVVSCGANPSARSGFAVITVDSSAVGCSVSGSATVCAGINTTTLTLSGHTGSVTKWQSSIVSDFSLVVTNITNTTTSLTATNLTTTLYYRPVLTSGPCGSGNSGFAKITVSPTSVAGSIAGSTTVCAGTNSTTLTLNGHTGNVTKWQSSTAGDFLTGVINISNTTTSLTATNLTVTTYYRAIVTSGVCSFNTTGIVQIAVSPQVVIKTITGASDVCLGANTRILTLIAGTVGTIQWQSALINSLTNESYWTNVGVPIAPTTDLNAANTFTATNLTQNTWYRVKLISGSCAANTYMVRVVVNPDSVAGTLSTSAAETCSGSITSVSLSGSVGVIKWYKSVNYGSLDASATWTAASGTLPTLSTGALTATTWYKAVVTSGVCSVATSNIVVVNISPKVIIKAITGASPVCYGTNSKTLTLAAGSVGSIQWQSASTNSTNEMDWSNVGTPILTTTALNALNTYTATNLIQNTWYRVKLTSGSCASANTFAVQIIVNQTSDGGIVSTSLSEICSGSSTSLNLSGSIGVIKWYKSLNYGSLGLSATWAVASGTLPTLSTGALTATTWYKAVVTSGVCSVATSNIVVVNISPKVIIKAITGASPVCYGTNSKTLTLAAGSVGSIQWQSASTNSTNEMDWSNVGTPILTTTALNALNTYTATNLIQNTWYRVKLTSASCASANTLAVQIIVHPKSVKGIVSTSLSEICSGSSTSLNLSGSVGVIKWYKSVNYGSLGVSATWAVASGILPTLSTGVLTATTWYKADVTSGVCSVATSNIVVVNVMPKPVAKNFTANVTSPTGALSAPLSTSLNVAKTFTIAAGSVGTIQWQTVASSTAPTAMTVWNNIVGATGTVYTVGNNGFAPSLGTNYFRVNFSNGWCTDLVSSTLVIYYNDIDVLRDVETTEEVEIIKKTPFEVKAYPNPYLESFNLNVKTSAQEAIELMVYDMTGRLVEQRRDISPSDDLPITEIGSAYPSGVYNVVITQGSDIKKATVIRK